MKKLTISLIALLGGCLSVAAQQPVASDSSLRSPGVRRMGTPFYRNPGDPQHVVRAELDNMPIKTPDSSLQYTILRSSMPNRYGRPALPPEGITPKKPPRK